MSELFARLEPPPGGHDRLHLGLKRRSRRRRRNQVLVVSVASVASVAALGLVLVSRLSHPVDDPTVVPATIATSLDPSLHPAIAVWSDAPPSGAELLDTAGTLRPITTQADDVVLYIHDPG